MSILTKELEQYLPSILSQAKNGIIISDPNKINNPVVYVNETTCNTFGYSYDEFVGRSCSFLQGKDRNQPEINIISKAIYKKESTTVTIRNYTKSGNLVYNQFTISPIYDDKKNLKYFLGIQRDVTKEKELELENERYQLDEVENIQYTTLGKLSAGLTHEINTPLTIINGNMELVKETIKSLSNNKELEYILDDIKTIEFNLKRIQNITETMREVADTSEIKVGELNLFRTIISALRLTYNKSKRITKITIQDEQFDLNMDRDTNIFMIEGDYKKLQQSFIAIINNSLDQLSQHGSYEKNCLDINVLEDKNYIKLTFKDNGGGFKPELLNDIFKPFNSNKKHKGLGIGLSVVKKIMNDHKFEIYVHNEDNCAIVSIKIDKNI